MNLISFYLLFDVQVGYTSKISCWRICLVAITLCTSHSRGALVSPWALEFIGIRTLSQGKNFFLKLVYHSPLLRWKIIVLNFVVLYAGKSWLSEGVYRSSSSSDQWQDEGYHTDWRRMFRGGCFQISITGCETLQAPGWKIYQEKNLRSWENFKCYLGSSKHQGRSPVVPWPHLHIQGKWLILNWKINNGWSVTSELFTCALPMEFKHVGRGKCTIGIQILQWIEDVYIKKLSG